MRRIALFVLFFGVLSVPAFAQDPAPVSLADFTARTQVGIGFQREWVTGTGDEIYAPKASWVAVVPVSFNLTPSTDAIGQAAYNMTTKSTRLVLGVRVVLFGKK